MFTCIILCRGSLHGYHFSAHWFSVRSSYFTQKFGDIFLAVYTSSKYWRGWFDGLWCRFSFLLVRKREDDEIVIKFSRGQVAIELFDMVLKIGDVILTSFFLTLKIFND